MGISGRGIRWNRVASGGIAERGCHGLCDLVGWDGIWISLIWSGCFVEQAVTGGPMADIVETDLEFIRAEGCDEGFSGEV